MAGGERGGRAPEAEWLTVPQVAQLYGVTPGRVRQMIHAGQVAADRNGRHWRVSRRWLDAQHAASGGLYPAADGRGLPGFLAQLNAWDEPRLRQLIRQETQRAFLEAVGVFAEANTLYRIVEEGFTRLGGPPAAAPPSKTG